MDPLVTPIVIAGSYAVIHTTTAINHWINQRNLTRAHKEEMVRLQNQMRDLQNQMQDQIRRMELEMEQTKDGLQLLFATAARVSSMNTTTRSIPPSR